MHLLCIRVSNNNETLRACEIFSQLQKIFAFREDERLQTNDLGLVRSFPTSANPLTMALKQFIPQQRPRYPNRKNKELFTIEMPTTVYVLIKTFFDSHWVLEQFSNDDRNTNTKVITSPNISGANSAMNESEFLAITSILLKAPERSRVQITTGICFASHQLEKLTRYFKANHGAQQSQSRNFFGKSFENCSNAPCNYDCNYDYDVSLNIKGFSNAS